MKAPDFWFRPPGLAARLLSPLGWAYHGAGRLRRLGTKGLEPGVAVICVGNLVAGGAGKTPVVLSLAGLLQGWGLSPHLLSRGYGGRLAGPVQVALDRHDAALVGDEPLLLAQAAPTWISRDRAAGARTAAAAGAGVLVLDDGFQNPALVHRLALVVADGGSGFGNGRVIPAGPLREEIACGLARASAVVIVGEDRTGLEAQVRAWATAARRTLPVLQARLIPEPEPAARLRGRRLLAFAGIGRPAKFFETCAGLGLELVATQAFPDHHLYRPHEVSALVVRAGAKGAGLVTTTKDWVRLPPAVRSGIEVLPVTVAWHDETLLKHLLAAALEHHV